MRKLVFSVWIVIILSSCVTLANPRTLGEVKENLNCLQYEEGMDWQTISGTFGEPNIAPLPEPGTDLSSNTRIYDNMVVIIYTKRQKFQQDGKIRFKEIVYKIEVCKKK